MTLAVHPHACGEYLTQPVRQPHARFIPTRVGNTLKATWAAMQETVHPHACGEYRLRASRGNDSVGSSPRVWGILSSPVIVYKNTRFIPTRVGNTPSSMVRPEYLTVHPHACGEYGKLCQESQKTVGSSPRVWGILCLYGRKVKPTRFIPTRVGNTRQCGALLPGRTVHPHACGEYYGVAGLRNYGIRFIPTRVGNTRRCR